MTAGDDRLRPLLADHLPEYRTADIRCLGTGVDHVAYLVGGEILVRLDHAHDGEPPDGAPANREPADGERTHRHEQQPERAADGAPTNESEREARLLRLVAEYSTLPVPVPLAVADGMLAYRALPGVPLLSRSRDWRRARSTDLGDVLGQFLASLRLIPAEDLSGIAEVDSEPPSAWLAEAQKCWGASGTSATKRLPNDRIERFLETPPPPQCSEKYFTHNDLGAEHVLIDDGSGEIAGVLDWTDAAITDPAVDLGLLLRDLGDGAFRAAARHLEHGDPAGLRDRAAFYARCRLLEDVRFGLENDRPEYVANSVAAAEWLFAG